MYLWSRYRKNLPTPTHQVVHNLLKGLGLLDRAAGRGRCLSHWSLLSCLPVIVDLTDSCIFPRERQAVPFCPPLPDSPRSRCCVSLRMHSQYRFFPVAAIQGDVYLWSRSRKHLPTPTSQARLWKGMGFLDRAAGGDATVSSLSAVLPPGHSEPNRQLHLHERAARPSPFLALPFSQFITA